MNNAKTVIGATAAIAVLALILGFFLLRPNTEEQVESVASQPDIVEQEDADEQAEIIAPEATVMEDPEPEIMEDATDEQLIEAVIAKDPVAVKQILEAGISPNIVNAAGNPILYSIILNRSDEGAQVITLLIEYGADVNVLSGDGNALLPMAAMGGKIEVVQLLLNAGADLNGTMADQPNASKPGGGANALMKAGEEGHLEIVALLIAQGADVNYTEAAYERKTIHYATWGNYPEIVSLLLENGADINPRSTWGIPGAMPLHWAARNSSPESAEVLINAGADLDAQSDAGLTPLAVVLGSGRLEEQSEQIAIYLLEAGADPNIQDNEGNTVLHDAARFRRGYAIPLLLEYGASLDLQNNNGDTALDLAKDEAIIEMLQEAGGG